jgi:hypothetical protein
MQILSSLDHLSGKLPRPVKPCSIPIYITLQGDILQILEGGIDHRRISFSSSEELGLDIGHRWSGVAVRFGMKGLIVDRAPQPHRPAYAW